MMDDFRQRGLFLLALALFPSAGFPKLHAKQVSVTVPSISFERLTSFVKWHVKEIAKIEQSDSFLFAPGN